MVAQLAAGGAALCYRLPQCRLRRGRVVAVAQREPALSCWRGNVTGSSRVESFAIVVRTGRERSRFHAAREINANI